MIVIRVRMYVPSSCSVQLQRTVVVVVVVFILKVVINGPSFSFAFSAPPEQVSLEQQPLNSHKAAPQSAPAPILRAQCGLGAVCCVCKRASRSQLSRNKEESILNA